jgi:hypothetical protein
VTPRELHTTDIKMEKGETLIINKIMTLLSVTE